MGTTTFLNVPFNNNGAVMVSSGVVSLNGGGTSAGSFTMTGGGHVDFAAGTHILDAGVAINGASTARVNGGTLTVAGAATALNLEINEGGTLDGAATLSVGGTLQWTGGTMAGSGLTQITAGASLSISGASGKNLMRAINNAGTTTWSQGQVNTGNTAIFTNQFSIRFGRHCLRRHQFL